MPISEGKSRIPDAGRRRHLSWSFDFDSRALTMGEVALDDWEPERLEMHRLNQASHRESMIHEFGEHSIDAKIENFIAIGTKPFSVLSYHNAFNQQVRSAFVMGYYYPALVGACALGERILNHLILDMRDYFKSTPQYRHVYRKNSFDNWDMPIDALEAWSILLPEAVKEFRALKALRHRSIHFNVSTYSTLRDDALAAIQHLRTIIEQQFGSFAQRPWFISGTLGHCFIRKAYEDHPFVATYFIPRCPFVGPLFGMGLTEEGWEFYDQPDYGDGDWTDEEFAVAYNERDQTKVVTEKPTIERLNAV
ncbi:hypothetical protein [Sphingomonas hengshuiensis]|uniref:hypothetical protein n=1 Tax=Sphingomonas hengshuiensis TaxID=1609977 RepID=UPI0012B80E36|nr:hypothetical protein [Sphingomonas hengshuiensis]